MKYSNVNNIIAEKKYGLKTTASAIQDAADWVHNEARNIHGYSGAYLSGSILEQPLDSQWLPDSDVDIVILFENTMPSKIGKIRWNDTLLEITSMSKNELNSIEHVLSTHYLAYALNGGQILDDPQGYITKMSLSVQTEFYKKDWLIARVLSTSEIAKSNIRQMTKVSTPEEKLMYGGFGTSAIALPILAAAGQNCTVRKRLPKARAVLTTYGFGAFSAELERVLGSEGLTVEQLLSYMDAIEEAFHCAMYTSGPSSEYAFRSDIRAEAMPVAIDGTRALLYGGNPSDAVFWMIATFARTLTILHMDDDATYKKFLPKMQSFGRLLGLENDIEIQERQKQALLTLKRAVEIGNQIASACAIKHS